VLYANYTPISELDLSNNPALTNLNLSSTNITELNLDNNPNLETVELSMSDIEIVHIQNGNNGLLAGTYILYGNDTARFNAFACNNLTCVYVDNASDAIAGINDYEAWNVPNNNVFVETDQECQTLHVYSGKILNELKIYPNPVEAEFTIKTNERINKVEIFDLTGKKIITYENQNKFDISSLKKGVYLVKVKTNNYHITTKLIKQ
jgi:hypothetical protein